MPENKKYNVVMFSMSSYFEWQPNWKGGVINRNYFVLQQLLKDKRVNKVLQVDFLPFNMRTFGKELLKAKIYKKDNNTIYKSLGAKTNKITDELFVHSTVKSWPINWGYQKSIKKALTSLNMQDDLLVFSYNPLFTKIFNKKRFPCEKTIFEAVDNWLEHPNFAKAKYQERLEKNYIDIAECADHVFTVSDDLRGLFESRENVKWVPNGVDFDHWQVKEGKELKDFKDIKKPIVGYHGILQERLDQDLLSYLANNNPDIDFVLIGWKWGRTDFSKIENYANVHFLGQKNYEELPQYINKFSVAIIPHKIDQFTKSMNPLKIYEYLAAGKQVVSTPVAGLELFENDIKVGNTKQEFNQHVLDLLKKNKSNKEGQNKIAQDHTWQKRLDSMFEKIKKS